MPTFRTWHYHYNILVVTTKNSRPAKKHFLYFPPFTCNWMNVNGKHTHKFSVLTNCYEYLWKNIYEEQSPTSVWFFFISCISFFISSIWSTDWPWNKMHKHISLRSHYPDCGYNGHDVNRPNWSLYLISLHWPWLFSEFSNLNKQEMRPSFWFVLSF